MKSTLPLSYQQKFRKVTLLVDNRSSTYPVRQPNKHVQKDLYGSAYTDAQKKHPENTVDPVKQDAKIIDQKSIIQSLFRRVSQLLLRVERLQKNINVDKREQTQLKTKFRRRANQINRNHKCSREDCQRIYGSETALRSHMRTKHLNLD